MSLSAFGESLLLLSAGRRGGRTVQKIIGNVGFPTPLVHCRTRHDLLVGCDPTSVMDVEVIRNGYYEPEVLEAILKKMPVDGVFWDVGANIGLHSMTVRKLRPDVKVVAFEPAPAPLARLMQNAMINGSELQILQVALGCDAGYSQMSVKLQGNTGISSMSPWPDTQYDSTALVRVERGDAIVASEAVPAPNLIKIDVEGFEKEVLLGLPEILASDSLNAIIFESSPELLNSTQELLTRVGFSISPVVSKTEGHPVNYVAAR